MKTIRKAFVLLLAVLMLVGMALPACAEELAPDAEPIAEESEPEVTTEPEATPEPEVTTEPEPTTAPEVTPEPEVTTEPEATPEPTVTPEPVPAEEAAPLALESEGGATSSGGTDLSLPERFPAMLQGDTFRLTQDLDLSGQTARFYNKSVTLDLNGHTLTVGSLQVDSNATVTLTDSVGTGCIKGPINVNVDSTLVLNGGTVTSTETETSTLRGTIEKGTGTTVFNGPVQTSSNTTISGGVFNGYVDNGGTINGGVFNGEVSTYGSISGGTFNGKVTSKYPNSTISGGVFNGEVSTYGSISGGVFCGDVPKDKLPTDKPVHTVTFDLNGGSGSIHEQLFVNTNTDTAHKPADPTRDGYAFLGWYNNSNQLYDFSKPVTENVSLIALWTPVYYGITYTGVTPGEDAPKYYAYDSYTALPKSTLPGFTLQWFESNEFSGDPVTAIKASVYGNKTFYGKMVAKNYTVTYDTGESITAPATRTKTWADKVLDGVDEPSKDGHTFGGWKCGNVAVGPNMTVAELADELNKDDSIESFALKATWIPDGNSGGDDDPSGGDDNPSGGGDDNPSGGGDDNPSGGGDNPSGGDDNPSGGGDNPSGGGDKTLGSTGGGSAKAPSSASKPAVPKTGDNSMIVLWLTLAAASALALGYVTLRKRKN